MLSAFKGRIFPYMCVSDEQSPPPQYLSCLTTSRSLTDKLAFDVGLQEDSTGTFKHSFLSKFKGRLTLIIHVSVSISLIEIFHIFFIV